MHHLIEGKERRLSPPRPAELTGYYTPSQNGGPLNIILPGNPSWWVPVFSSVEKMEESCAELGIRDYSVKQITDGFDFVTSIVEAGGRVMLDPYRVSCENKTRWTEIVPWGKKP